MKFLDVVTDNLEKRFPDMTELDAFGISKPQSWPEDHTERDEFGSEELQEYNI